MGTPPGGGAEMPGVGYYPDPSIPGYIRYWNGAAWVPGTSRPAPAEGESMPAPPPGVTHTQVIAPAGDETGPMFLDEDPAPGPAEGTGGALPEVRQRGEMDVRDSGAGGAGGAGAQPVPPGGTAAPVDWDDPRRLHGSRPEPATAWQADASRQAGFGGEQDRRVSWGSEHDGPGGAPAGPLPGVPDPRRAAEDPAGGGDQPGNQPGGPDNSTLTMRGSGARPPKDRSTQALPPVRRNPELPPADGGEPAAAPGAGTLSGRAPRPQGGTDTPTTGQGRGQGQDQGTMAFRAVGRGVPGQGAGAAGTTPPAQPQQPQQPQQPYGGVPPQGGAPSGPAWQQQVHQLAQQHGQQPGAPQPGAPQQGGQQQGGQQPGQQGAPEGVIPWKPPVDNPFLQAAQAQGRPAPLGRRLLARLIDTVVLLGIVGAAALPLWSKASDHIEEKVETAKRTGETVTVYLLDGTTGGYLGMALGLLLVLGIVLEALPTAAWGRTLGKKLAGVRVLDIEGHSKPSFGAALRRWLVYSVLGLLVIGVLNVLWCLFDRPWRQCWHDKAARTFVAASG
ncbi:RDD family protein [Streptomyces sp. NA02950]|uniref:RDD family protein n=1 Tax=Streptomyces sp. NA02950 TaxID=2742137 RepID=UPI00159035EC|nr:RDD family protein [Streptomyces sp. NA02950]QKV94718.1 RDD family protein [Streptomyces sp. NA02950]